MFERRTRAAWTCVSGTTTPGVADASQWMPPPAETRSARSPMPIFAIITMQPPARTACRLTRALLRTETLPQRFTAAPEEGR